eukprot:629705-Rhodomonas_salina.2
MKGKAICSLYEARPKQCRTWPFWPENLASPEVRLTRPNFAMPGTETWSVGTRIGRKQVKSVLGSTQGSYEDWRRLKKQWNTTVALEPPTPTNRIPVSVCTRKMLSAIDFEVQQDRHSRVPAWPVSFIPGSGCGGWEVVC